MLNTQNTLLKHNAPGIPSKLIFALSVAMLAVLLWGVLSRVDSTASTAPTTVQPVAGFICPSGDAQVSRYAGQVISMGCTCQSGYRLIRGEDAALGAVEWEICK